MVAFAVAHSLLSQLVTQSHSACITILHTVHTHNIIKQKTGAAIEHYRRGVDANPKDFRAWNGLGHTYEFMQMHLFALYYFRRVSGSALWLLVLLLALRLHVLQSVNRHTCAVTAVRLIQQLLLSSWHSSTLQPECATDHGPLSPSLIVLCYVLTMLSATGTNLILGACNPCTCVVHSQHCRQQH
jgi:hypothetical protein